MTSTMSAVASWKPQHFEDIKRLGKKISGTYLTLLVLTNKTAPSGFKVIVSKQVDKRAVVRNKVRRQIKEIIRTGELLPNKGVLALVIVKALPPTVNALYNDLTLLIDKGSHIT